MTHPLGKTIRDLEELVTHSEETWLEVSVLIDGKAHSRKATPSFLLSTVGESSRLGLITAKHLPLTNGQVILPDTPLGGVVNNQVIVHLQDSSIVEMSDVVLHTDTNGQTTLTLNADDYALYREVAISVTVCYLGLLV